MTSTIPGQDHPTGDDALSFLVTVPGAIGNFVRTYPGIQVLDDLDWLDGWFRARINLHFSGALSETDTIQPPDSRSGSARVEPLAQSVRLQSVQPHYFRGFREVPRPIRMDGDLVAIDGRNSSGKTSLAEALEWLFSGSLSRRESKELGNPRELENCVSSQFRPDDDETWVHAVFDSISPGGVETLTLRRVLKADYGTTSTATCTSILFMNDQELTLQEERKVLDELFASVPPLLMQHTLRLFVESDPRHRREYFERLLRLDELTNLISRSVVGDDRLAEYSSPTGSVALQRWESLGSLVQVESSKRAHRRASRSGKGDLTAHLREALTLIGHHEFSALIDSTLQYEEIGVALTQEQRKARQKSFPLLSQLRPQQQISDDPYQSSYAADVAKISK
ncbi:MAG: ATP-binding protein, partial [Dehalococcoidia bacterium]